MPSEEHDRAASEIGELLAQLGPSPTPAQRVTVWERRLGHLALSPGVAVEAAGVPGVTAEWLRPAAATRSGAVIQYHHGGGYSGGSLLMHRHFVSRLAAATTAPILNVGYRLAPEHVFPAALDDALASYRWLLERYEPEQIVIGGDSAGGGLAAALLHAARAELLPMPGGLMMLAPLLDVRPARTGKPSIVDLYLAGHDPADPLVSPLLGDLAGFPPTYLQVSATEDLYEQAVEFAAAAGAAGVDVHLEAPGDLIHTWPVLAPDAPETEEAIARLGRFVIELAQPAGPYSDRAPTS
jgi:acetyl esterase/lipase